MLIAVDADGGDYAPREIVKGAAEAANEYKLNIALIGRKTVLDMLVRRYGKKQKMTIIETSQTIDCNENPLQAVRTKPDSSIVIGTKLVKSGEVSAFVSAGNTGAVLTSSYLNLDRIEGIKRPALCGIIHITNKPVFLIDVGANVDCQPDFLLQFGYMGATFARGFLEIDEPRVGLLNNGEEDIKGNSLTKDSYKLLKKAHLNFIGNIEGHDILNDKADVIVTDGFIGNIVLKTMEGFGNIFQGILGIGQSFKVDTQLQGSALVHYVDLTSLVKRMDYKEYGGACLLGVNGNIIVAHGRSHSTAIKNAIHLAHDAVGTGVVNSIRNGQNVGK